MPRREFDPIAPLKVGGTDADGERSQSMTGEARHRCAPGEAACEIVPDHSDQQEAWAIAAELIADLGASDAVAWADDYMLGLHEKGDRRGMQRWEIVVSALDELASANVHYRLIGHAGLSGQTLWESIFSCCDAMLTYSFRKQQSENQRPWIPRPSELPRDWRGRGAPHRDR